MRTARVSDVDFMRGIVTPTVQWPGEPLKTETSRTAVPIPSELSAELAASVARWPGETVGHGRAGRAASPWSIDREIRAARRKVDDLPEGGHTS